MTNPFYDALDDFRCEEVVAIKDGEKYTGWVKVWSYSDESLILLDAIGPDGDRVGQTHIKSPDVVYETTPETEIRTVDPREVAPSPYSVREFNTRGFQHYVRQTRERGSLGSFPLVRETDSGLVTLEGHKRLEAARRAGLDEVPVRTTEMGDWEFALRWIEDHIPTADMNPDNEEGHQGWYTPEQISAALDLLRNDWDDERLEQLPQFEECFAEPTIIDEPRELEADVDV